MKETVDLIEIWAPIGKGGQAITKDGKNMELVACVINGNPLKLKKDWYMELRQVTKEESRRIIESYQP